MNINIKATGIELTDAITEYVYKKIGAVEKLIPKGAAIQVEVGKTTNHHKHGSIFKGEVRITGDGMNMYAVKEAEDLYSAIDMVEGEVRRELLHVKGKNFKMLRDGQKTIKNMMKGFPWMGKKKL
ncbi:MAG: Ribosomal subunit interface protein [Parcubacteria group bacterium]|nr:Ribosomal subunit interface protein [Parcubacteria group bacterium]